MFVSCNIAENYWVGRSGFLFFFNFLFRIVMHHNAAKSKNRHNDYTLNFDIFTLEDKLRHVLKLSIWFEINSHESKICFPLFFPPRVNKKFWVGGVSNRVGRVTGNKHNFFGIKFLNVCPFDYTAVAVSGKVGPVNQVNHTSWVAVVTPTDRHKSVRNRCVIELYCGVVCVFFFICIYSIL